MEPAIELASVTKRFGDKVAVDALSLTVPRGCIHGFLGKNGAGKTTTLRMIMSILMPDSGTIRVLGEPDAERIKDRLGYLPEEKGLYKKMRTGELIAYFGRLKGMDAREAKTKAVALLQRYGLGNYVSERCESLSKGMGQKVQVLGTLIHEPELVILDEPFSGLDPINTDVLRDIILDIKRQGRTVVFSTHVMEQAEQICDSLVLIDQGRVRLEGPIASVLSSGDQGVRVDFEGDFSFVKDLPGVARVDDKGTSAEIVLSPGADPQELLRALVARVKIRRFDLREPSLHELFVRTVGSAS